MPELPLTPFDSKKKMLLDVPVTAAKVKTLTAHHLIPRKMHAQIKQNLYMTV